MYHIIINPASRSGRGAKIWAEQVEPALKAGNTEYQTYFSGKAGEVRQLAAQITAEHAAAMIWPEIWEFPRIQRLLSI